MLIRWLSVLVFVWVVVVSRRRESFFERRQRFVVATAAIESQSLRVDRDSRLVHVVFAVK